MSVQREITNRIIIFSTPYFAYAFTHATRKTLSSVKPLSIANLVHHVDKTNITIHPKELCFNSHPLFISSDDAATFMGTLDFIFMISYALGLFIAGRFGDRIDPRHFRFGGMISMEYFGVSIIAHSFPSARGLILGFWLTSASIENIIEYVFLTTSYLLAGMAYLVLTAILSAIVQTPTIPECVESLPQVSLFQILCLLEFVSYALPYACLKLVNYSFFSGFLSIASINLTWMLEQHLRFGDGISDLSCVSRSCVNITFLLLPCVLIYRIIPVTPWALNGFVMGLTGFIIAGPANLPSAVFGTDLAAILRPCGGVYLEFKLLIGSLCANVVLIDLSASIPAGGLFSPKKHIYAYVLARPYPSESYKALFVFLTIPTHAGQLGAPAPTAHLFSSSARISLSLTHSLQTRCDFLEYILV
ncbi:hypothetical protein ACTXT7_005857 [Hymenolepis weldensis]